MFNFLDVVKWKYPQNYAESQDMMVVEDTEGVFVSVRHLSEDGFGNVSHEKAEDLKYVGRCTAYEKAEDVYGRYKNA